MLRARSERSQPLLECGRARFCHPEGISPVSFKELLESWRAQAAAPRTAASYAVQLPLDDAARLAALAEMFPGRTREQLITELLGQALQEIVAAMPYVPGTRVISTDEQGDPVYEDAGPTPRFMALSRSHYVALELAGPPPPAPPAAASSARPAAKRARATARPAAARRKSRARRS